MPELPHQFCMGGGCTELPATGNMNEVDAALTVMDFEFGQRRAYIGRGDIIFNQTVKFLQTDRLVTGQHQCFDLCLQPGIGLSIRLAHGWPPLAAG